MRTQFCLLCPLRAACEPFRAEWRGAFPGLSLKRKPLLFNDWVAIVLSGILSPLVMTLSMAGSINWSVLARWPSYIVCLCGGGTWYWVNVSRPTVVENMGDELGEGCALVVCDLGRVEAVSRRRGGARTVPLLRGISLILSSG